MAAQAAGLPFRALKVLQKHAETAVLKAHLHVAGPDEKLSKKQQSIADAAKREAEQIAAIRKKYRKQYIKFKQNFAKLKKSFSENKGTLFNLFLIPMMLSGLMVFYVVRYVLRLTLPEGFMGYDWDQARNEQMKPNFILLFICDLGLIGFVKAASKIYCEGSTIELYLPDAHEHWGFWKPPRDLMNHVCLTLFFLYPVAFLYFTARELAKNQRQVIYNKALKGYADKEGCLEIRASQNAPFPIPVLGQLASKVNFAMSTNIKSVSPILWAKNTKGEYIYDKTKKTHWVLGLGTMLEGKVKLNTLELAQSTDTARGGTHKSDVYYQWDQIKVGKVEDSEKTPLKEGDVLLKIGSRDDFEMDKTGYELTDKNGRKIIRMREIPYISLSALEDELSDRCWVEVRRNGEIKKFQMPPAKLTTGFDVCTGKVTGVCKGAAKGGGGLSALAGLTTTEEPLSATSQLKLNFMHSSMDSSSEVVTTNVDRDYEVRVFVGSMTDGFSFKSKMIPTKAGDESLDKKKSVRRSDSAPFGSLDPSNLMMSHATDSISWKPASEGNQLQVTEPASMGAEWKELPDTNLGYYKYSLKTGGKSLRTDIIMEYKMVKPRESGDDLMSQLADAKGMCCGAEGVAGDSSKGPEFDVDDAKFYQRIYSEEAKYDAHTCLTGMGIGKQPLKPQFDRAITGEQVQEETDSKDVENVDNPWFRDPTYDTKYCRRILQLPIPEKLALENADGEKVLANLNHINKIVLRGMGSCSRGQSEVFLVLRQASRSLKLDFSVVGSSYYARSVLAKLKENPTPGQQAMERTVTGLCNAMWEKTKELGGQPITDQFVSIEKWKVVPGNPFAEARLQVSVDVDLDKSGFVEQGTEDGYDLKTKELVDHCAKAFQDNGKGFLTLFLRDLAELMGSAMTQEENTAFATITETFIPTKGKPAAKCYLDSIKEKSKLGTLKKKLTQIKFEDDFDHPCLNQAVGKDTLEVWICGPCYNGVEANFKVATASITCEKDAARTKEQFAEVKLHSDVFCGRDGISVEASDVIAASLGFLAKDGGATLAKKQTSKSGGKVYSGIVQTDQDETTPATKAQIMEQTALHKGLSPEGVPYRLSDAFDRFPNAYVGRKRFQLSVLGDFNYEMAGRIENRHVPVLHYFSPDYQMEVPVKHLSFPRRDYYNHFYSQMKENQRWNFLFSRVITLVSILMVIYMGQAKSAMNGALDAGASELSHLTEHEKKAAVAAAKKTAETSAGFVQLVALFVGTFVTFATAAYPDIMEAYKEKEKERLNELKDANMKESAKMCGLVAQYDKLLWFSQKQHRNFALDAVMDGASFMYAAEVMLILILLFGHEGSPFVLKIPMALDAWMLILVTGYTLVKLNAEFLAVQAEKMKKRIAEADDRIIAEYEAKMKIYTEKKKQVMDFFDLKKWIEGFKKKKAAYQDKIDAIQDRITQAFATAEKLRQMAEARAKAAEEAEKKKLEQGLVEEGETEDEMETVFIGKVNESPAKKPLLSTTAGAGDVEMTAFGSDKPLPSARRQKFDSVESSNSAPPLTARTVEKLAASEKSKWDDMLVKSAGDVGAAPTADSVDSITAPTKKSEVVVIPGAKALVEVQAVTGLSQQGPFVTLGKLVRAILKTITYPFVVLLSREQLSALIKSVAAVFGTLGVMYALFSTDSTFSMVFILAITGVVAKAIFDAGARAATPSEAEKEEQKLQQKAKALQERAQLEAKKVTSIHTKSVLKDDGLNAKDHVVSALEACEAVDAAWAKGEHTFVKMPPAMIKTQKRVVPDVNRGWFELKLNHFAAGKQPDAQEIGTSLNSDDMFTMKDYVFDVCDIIVDTLGLRLPSDVKPVRHTKTLTKKLLQVNKPLGTTRDLVQSFPIQISVETLRGEAEKNNKQTQVACTLQIVNFVGKGQADRADNDSYLTLTDQKTIGAKKGAGVNIDTYKVGDDIIFNDLKKGDLFEIVQDEEGEEVTRIPKLADQGAWQKATDGQKLTSADIVYEDQEPFEIAEDGGPDSPTGSTMRGGGARFEIAEDGGPDSPIGSTIRGGAGTMMNNYVEGQHSAAPKSPLRGKNSTDSLDGAVAMEISKWRKPALLELRPDDLEKSNSRATIYEIENTYGNYAHVPRELRGTPLPQKLVRFKVRNDDGEKFSFAPVKPGAGQGLLCKQEGELSLEEQKARKCADWFNAVDGWFEDLGASSNLRSNVHAVFDELFWGKDTMTQGGRPADVNSERKKFKKGERKDLPNQQKGLLARVLERKDAGLTVKEYFDYLMYGAEDDNEWPGFIYWFRFKPKGEQEVEQLNKNPKFRYGAVVPPGPIVGALAKPALTPQVLHVVLTDADLRAPGDVVDAWQPQRGEPHTAEMFKLDKEGYSRGVVGLLKLLPDKLQFEQPVGDGEVDAETLADTLNFDFSDTYAMFPVVKDVFKINPKTGVEELTVTGKTLYLQMKGGDIIAFGMDQKKIEMWADLIEKYQMSTPQQFILGYDGNVSEHPEDPNLQIREGKQGYQKFYLKSNCPGVGYVPKSRYCGSWKNHKYHGDGMFYKLQVAEKCPHVALYPGSNNPLGHKMKDVFLLNDREHLHHSKANYERQVIMYDGNFENGLRCGKGMAFFPIPTAKGKLLYRFNGVWCKDRPVLGELMYVSGPIEQGSPTMKYYFGTVVPLNAGKKTGDGKAEEFLKTRLMDISPFEVYAAACLSCGSNGMSPSQVLYQLKKDYAALISIKSKKLEKLAEMTEPLNAKIEETRRTYGYYDEPLSDFDTYILSRCLEPLKKMPNIKNLMEPDGKDYFRDGLNINDYKFTQKLNVRDFHCDEYIRDDLDVLYKKWFKYECYDDEDQNSKQSGTIYAVDADDKTKWDSYKKGLASLAEDWNKFQKEIAFEDAIMLMEMGRKKKPKWMSSLQQKSFCEDLLLQCLPAKEVAPAWYSQVSGEVYAEEHAEMKEVFRSLSRKLSAIFPTAPAFSEELWEKMPKVSKTVTEKKLANSFASGSDLDLPTQFTKYMGRLLQVNGIVDDAGLVAEFQDELLGMYDGQDKDDPWTQGKLFDSLKDRLCLNGFMAMQTVDEKKQTIDFAAPMVNGQASGKNAYVATNEFSYAGDYADGKFDGQGVLNVKEGALKKFQGLKKYDGEWKDGLKHGKAVIEHISTTNDVSNVDGKFEKGKLSEVTKIVCTGGIKKDSYKMIQEGKQKVLVFSVDGSKKEVKLTVPSGDVGKLKQKNLDINGPIDVKAEGCAIKGTVSKHQLQGKGLVEGAGGKYDGNFANNQRSGQGVWTFGEEAVFEEDAAKGNYKGTTVTCDGVTGKFDSDKPTGKFKVEIVKDGKKVGTVNYTCLKAGDKARVNMLSCPPACCAAPLPAGMLDEKFPRTQALPFGAVGGIPLEFNDITIKVEYPAITPWGEALKF
ncbi:unnamed protein product [Amoebophrya sp. A120]|nr:unnamed protein product [Amoebophrya sp. A120]|eukprot:GSA120T00017171001.1